MRSVSGGIWAGRPGVTLRDGGASSLTAVGSTDWTWHEVTTSVPRDAAVIRFGISLTGSGRIELRDAELTPARPEASAPRPEAQE